MGLIKMFPVPMTIKIVTKEGIVCHEILYEEKIKNLQPDQDWINEDVK